MNLTGMFKSLLCAILPALLLSTCVTIIIETGNLDTDDLAMVVADAKNLAISMGSDQVLVVFDIDNTLLAMEQGLGSDQWYEWQKEQASENPCDERVVHNRLTVQGAMYFASAMRPAQPNAADLVRQILSLRFGMSNSIMSPSSTIASLNQLCKRRLMLFSRIRSSEVRFQASGSNAQA